MTRNAARLLLLLFFVVLPVAAQNATTVRFRTVDLPVSVLDAEGNPVRGLTAPSFDLLEDGKRQTLTEFRTVDYTRVPAAALTPLPPAGRRSFLLLFDLGVTPAAREREQEAARRFVKDVALPRDLVAVGAIESGHTFRLLCAFTTDRELAGSAIDDPRAFRGNDPLQIANQSVIWGGAGSASEPPTVPAPPLNQPPAERIDKVVDAVGQLASALRREPGRKQIVLLTEDIPSGGATRETIDRTARMCRTAAVMLHVVNVAAENGGLGAVAAATGGETVRGGEGLPAAFARILKRQEILYILTYDTVIGDTPGKFHEVSVRVPNVPHANVIAPTGQYEPGIESGFERVMDDAEVVVNDIRRTELHVDTLVASFPTGGVIAQVPVVVDVNGLDLWPRLGSGAPVDVFVYAFDTTGVVRDRIFQRMTIDPAKTIETLRKGGLKYVAALALPPGKYAIRTLVTLGDARGFTRVDTDVRPPKQLSLLPPLIFDEPSQWVLVRGATHGDAPYPYQLNGQPFIPSARADVKNGHPEKMAVFVLNAAPNDLIWQMTVTDSAGKAHTVTPAMSALQGEGVTKLVFDYTPTDLAPGAATATFTIAKKSSNESQRTSVAMVVVQ